MRRFLSVWAVFSTRAVLAFVLAVAMVLSPCVAARAAGGATMADVDDFLAEKFTDVNLRAGVRAALIGYFTRLATRTTRQRSYKTARKLASPHLRTGKRFWLGLARM